MDSRLRGNDEDGSVFSPVGINPRIIKAHSQDAL
jgi:hypothetical protein